MQSTAKGQAFMSLQSGGGWSQQDISSAAVTAGTFDPTPADAADEPPTTRLTTARIVSNRERASQNAIPNTFTSGPLGTAASDHMIDTAPGFKVIYWPNGKAAYSMRTHRGLLTAARHLSVWLFDRRTPNLRTLTMLVRLACGNGSS